MGSPRHWRDLARPDFASLPTDTVAILPVAAIEQHGPHLPLNVDAAINAGILAAALDLVEAPVLALPMQSIGLSIEHIRFPGTLTLSAETLITVLTEIGQSVARAGVRRLLILNSHGGQPRVVDIVCRRLLGAGMFAAGCMLSQLGLPPSVVLTPEERDHGIHGGLVETSLMLHLHPDQVRMDRAINFRSAFLDRAAGLSVLTPEGGVGFGWETQDLHPAGALGDASRATAETGAEILAWQSARLAVLLAEMRAFDLDTWFRSGPAA